MEKARSVEANYTVKHSVAAPGAVGLVSDLIDRIDGQEEECGFIRWLILESRARLLWICCVNADRVKKERKEWAVSLIRQSHRGFEVFVTNKSLCFFLAICHVR